MEEHHGLTYGEEPGIRFACVLDGHGGCRALGLDELCGWSPDHGVLWVHMERDDPAAETWLKDHSGLDPMVIAALLDEDSRPRVEDFDDSLLVFLRGLNRNEREEPVDLVPLHMWVEAGRLISLRDRDHFLMALRAIRDALHQGRGPQSVGGLLAAIAERLVDNLEPLVDELEDQVEDLDEHLAEQVGEETRAALGELRRNSSKLRRYVAPQREALTRLQAEDARWLGKRDRIRLRETADRVARYVESLDSVRDRATILHEDLTSLISVQISKNSHRLTAVAAVLLPPSVIAGIFGMNVGGLPANQDPHGFWILCLGMLALMPIEYLILKRFKWI